MSEYDSESDYECGDSDDEWSSPPSTPPTEIGQLTIQRMQDHRLTELENTIQMMKQQYIDLMTMVLPQNNTAAATENTTAPVVEPTLAKIVPLVDITSADSTSMVGQIVVSDLLPPTTTPPVGSVTETIMESVPTVANKKIEPKPTKASSTAKAKAKPKKTKLQKTEQKAKAVSYYGCYSYSASMRQSREQQLWVDVDLYFDDEQANF